MGMGRKERRELVAATISQLEEVLPASGKPEELVRLTTAIVQSTKKLLDGTPEDLRTKTTATLSDFVVAARIIAKDPRSVDSSSRQALSSSRRAVDALVRELSSWHDRRQSDEQPGEEPEVVLRSLTRITSESVSLNRLSSSFNGGGGGVVSPTTAGGTLGLISPEEAAVKERDLRNSLKKEQITLWKKTEPQQAPVQHGKPSEVLTQMTGKLKDSAKLLVEVASQKTPPPAELLQPALDLTGAVSVLLDLVDSIFVNRYPMRSQVHGFCCTLVENSLSFGSQSRTEDVSSLRTITTEVPALMSAAEVMITQSHNRAKDLEGQKKMSLQRSNDLQLLGAAAPGAMGMKKRGGPPKPPNSAGSPVEKEQEKLKEFDIICVLCTNVAVNQEDKKPMPKGTEVPLLAYSSTNILDVKRMLQTRTGIARDSIEIKMQGDDVLPDSTRVKSNNPVPYFVFNVHEPSDRELEEMRKIQKLNSRVKLEDVDWSQFTGPVAIALFDYDALGEDGTLNFDEGEIVEIIEKSHDGWWRGRKEGEEGDFPASFVEEIEIPRTKEERKRLAQRYRKKSPDKTSDDEGRQSPGLKKLKKLHSNPEPGSSPLTARAVFDRRVSEPVLPDVGHSRRDKKKLGGFFKKRNTQYGHIQEESTGDTPGKKAQKKKPTASTSSWEDVMVLESSPEPQRRAAPTRPTSAPKLQKQRPGSGGIIATGDAPPKNLRPRRPPPPVPASSLTSQQATASRETSPDHEQREGERRSSSSPKSPPTFPPSSKSPETPPEASELDPAHSRPAVTLSLSPDSVKKSESMEELLKNLEEFDEVISSQNDAETPEVEGRERDFATIPRSELPPALDRKSKSPSRTPEPVPRHGIVENGHAPGSPKPTAPPRRKKKMSQKLIDRVGIFEGSESGEPDKPVSKPVIKPVRQAPKVSGAPPPKPERDEKKRMKTRLEVMAVRQESSSAPVSRNASPDITDFSKLTKENSASSEMINSQPASTSLSKRSPPLSVSTSSSTSSSSTPSYTSSATAHTLAINCIIYLSEEDRVTSHSLFQFSPSSSASVDSWLRTLDRGEVPDLSKARNIGDVSALLKALLSIKRLGPVIQYPLAKAMCELVKSTSPVSVLGSQLEQLSDNNRKLLKDILRLFGLIINHSDKNKTEMTDLNRMFGALLFDRMPPAQTEQLLAYLVSTCELLIAS